MPHSVGRLLLSTFAVAALASQAAPAAGEPPATPNTDVLRMYMFDQRALVFLRAGDHPIAPVVFDTGTSGNIMDTKFAAALGLPNTGVADSVDGNSGNHVAGYASVIEDASIDQVKLSHVETTVLPYEARGEVGIVGPNLFKGRLVYLEFGRSEVILRDKTAENIPDGASHNYIDDGDPLPGTEVRLPGMTIHAYLDSGNNSPLILPLDMAKRLPLKAPPVVVGRAHGVGDNQDVYQAYLKGAIRIGAYSFSNIPVSFTATCRVPNVGLPLIRKMTVVLDPEEKRDWIVAPGDAIGQPNLYVGHYGARSIRALNGALMYQREDRPPHKITPAGKDMFDVTDTGDQIMFHREGNRITGMEFISASGTYAFDPRTPDTGTKG